MSSSNEVFTGLIVGFTISFAIWALVAMLALRGGFMAAAALSIVGILAIWIVVNATVVGWISK